jgi:hypothetical protein
MVRGWRNNLTDLIRGILAYGLVAVVVITVWTVAWASSIQAQADQGWWPALHDAPQTVNAGMGGSAARR